MTGSLVHQSKKEGLDRRRRMIEAPPEQQSTPAGNPGPHEGDF